MDKRLPHVVHKAQVLCRENQEYKSILMEYMRELSKRSPLERVKFAHKVIDDSIENNKSNSKTRCKKGCAFCCYHKIEVTPSEAQNIKSLNAIKNMDALSCPFLASDNACGIYEERPIICRLTHVVSEPDHCEIDSGKEVEHLMVEKASLMALAYFSLESNLLVLREHI